MKVRDWLIPFIGRYRARILPHDWPESSALPGSEEAQEWVEFLKGWLTALALAQATEAEADAALDRLTLYPPRFRRDHVPALIQTILSIRQGFASEKKTIWTDRFDHMPPITQDEEIRIISSLAERPERDPIGRWAKKRLQEAS